MTAQASAREVCRPLRPRSVLGCGRGSAAVEFAFVALPFFGLLFAIIETTMVLFVSVTLENGMSEASRLIRTGQVQSAEMTAGAFRERICAEVVGLLDCDDRLVIDVRAFEDFGTVEFAEAMAAGDLAIAPQFDPGGPGEVILVRAFYVWEVLTPIMGHAMANMSAERRLIASSAVFRNEPFGNILPSS